MNMQLSPAASKASTAHPTIEFLEALGKQSVFIRSWLGKDYEDLIDPQGRKIKAYNVRCDRSGTSLSHQRWDRQHWGRLILELSRQNAANSKPVKSFPYQEGGWVPYAVINSGGHTKDAISECHALFLEFDAPITKEEAMLKLQVFSLQPSAMIESRAGLHCYWFLERATTTKLWQQFQWRLIEFFESDKGITDYSRCMRLPGFYHLKQGHEPYLVNLKECHADRRYTLEQFDELLPEAPAWRLKLDRASKPYERIRTEEGEAWDIRNFKHVLNHYVENSRREWDTCQCPVHARGDNHSTDSLHISSQTGAFHCWNGCEAKDIYKEICAIAGWKREKQGSERPSKAGEFVKPAVLLDEAPKTVKELHDESVDGESPVQKRYRKFREEVMIALTIDDDNEREFCLDELGINYRKPKSYMQKLIDELTQRRKTEGRAKTRYKLSEILNLERKGTSYLIEDWLPMGESILETAKAKTGKSLMAYEAAYAVLTGGLFLNKFRCKKGRVLIIQTEEGLNEIQKRLIGRGYDEVSDDDVEIWTDFKINRDNVDLEAKLAELRPSLVIVDSLRKISSKSGIDENKAEFAHPVYELTDIVRSYGASLIVIHHDNKDKEAQGIDAIAGTSALAGAVWGSWRLLRTSTNEDDSNRQLSCTIRGGAGSRHNVKLMEGEAKTWYWTWEGEVNADPIVHKHEETILRLLHMNGEMSMSNLVEYANLTLGDRSFYRPTNRLLERGRIVVRRDERNKKLWWYSLPPYTPPLSTVGVCNPDETGALEMHTSSVQNGDHAQTLSLGSNQSDLKEINKQSPKRGGDEIGSEGAQGSAHQSAHLHSPIAIEVAHPNTDVGGSVKSPTYEVNGVVKHRTDISPKGVSLPQEQKKEVGRFVLGHRVGIVNPTAGQRWINGKGAQITHLFDSGAKVEMCPSIFGFEDLLPWDEYQEWQSIMQGVEQPPSDTPEAVTELNGFKIGDCVRVAIDHMSEADQHEIIKYNEAPVGEVGTIERFKLNKAAERIGKTVYNPVVNVDGDCSSMPVSYLRHEVESNQ